MQVLCLFGPNQFPVLLSRAGHHSERLGQSYHKEMDCLLSIVREGTTWELGTHRNVLLWTLTVDGEIFTMLPICPENKTRHTRGWL